MNPETAAGPGAPAEPDAAWIAAQSSTRRRSTGTPASEDPQYHRSPTRSRDHADTRQDEEEWPDGTEAKPDPARSYTVPQVAPAGWSAQASRRRDWLCRGLLLLILGLQAVLSVRLHNTAYQDEALYAYAGRVETAHLLHGAVLNDTYNTYFSGSPWLYPLLAGPLDSAFGLTGPRVLSLLAMLGCTALLYALTRRLFNERAALGAAAAFSITQSTIFLGWFATYDSVALFLLALAAWTVVRTSTWRLPGATLAAPVLVLAAGTKYASGIFLPSVVALAVLAAWPRSGWRALWRAAVLTAATVLLGAVGLYYSDTMAGIRATTTARAHDTFPTHELLSMSLSWGGLTFAAACWGSVSYVRRSRMHEVAPAAQTDREPDTTRLYRIALCLLLCGTALLAPAYQIHLHTATALHKHIGFGLFFAAPMAGIGLTRLMGPHFRRTEVGVLVWAVLLSSGIAQSAWRFQTWPDSTSAMNILQTRVNPNGHYLADASDVPVYYLKDRTTAAQWDNTYFLAYTDANGARTTGPDAYAKAIADGYYDLVLLDGISMPATERVIEAALAKNGRYRLYAVLPFTNTTGSYRVWIKE